MPISFSNTQRVSKNTRLSNNISEALIRALGINNLNNDATVNQLKDAISAKLSAIGGGVTPENLLAILSDVGNVQGSIVNDELALNTAYLTVSNMTTLTDAQINALACGDTVVKEDSSGKHQYIVTYKKDEVGICITYFDATYLETVSYDYTDGHWVYNSMDVTDLSNLPSGGGTQLYKHTITGSANDSNCTLVINSLTSTAYLDASAVLADSVNFVSGTLIVEDGPTMPIVVLANPEETGIGVVIYGNGIASTDFTITGTDTVTAL